MNFRLCHIVTLALGLAAPVVQACDTALILTIDVSNSIDVAEYHLQTDGMADALLIPTITPQAHKRPGCWRCLRDCRG